MPFLKANNINLYYEQHGQGESLVLIPGFGGTHANWLGIVPQLQQHFLVTIFDPRGAGQSDAPAGPYDIATLAADLAELLEALKINRTHVCGQSMGGMIAQYFAIHYPQHLNKLILSSTTARPISYRFTYLNKLNGLMVANGLPIELVLRNVFFSLMSRKFLQDEARVETVLKFAVEQAKLAKPEGRAGQFAAIVNHHCSERELARIKAPTLVLAGDDDLTVDSHEALFLAEHINGAKAVIFKDCGHILALEEPEKFVKQLVEFL